MSTVALRTCECEAPSPKPNKPDTCVKCDAMLDPAWLSTAQTLEEFFDRLARGCFEGHPDEDFEYFRSHCEAREMAGRDTFGLAYLSRDNRREATEEAVDLALYMHLDILQAIREYGDDEDMAFALEAARHAYLAHQAVRRLAAKRRGSP